MYIIKTKGTGNISDFIQLRNDNFVLISHFKVSRCETALRKLKLNLETEKIKNIIHEIDYGEIKKIIAN